MMHDHHRVFLAAVVLICVCFGSSRAVTDYHEYDFTKVRDGEGYPTDREGTVYGNVGGHEIYFAGGVNFMTVNRTQSFGFKDIYTYNTNTNTFVKANAQLPTSSFFGSGGILKRVLFIYSGASYAARGSNAYNFTYFNDLYSADFTVGDLRSPIVNTIRLQPPVTPRVYSSGFVALNGLLYVFGGATGPDAVDAAPDVFFSIDTATGKTTQLPCLEDNNCPKFSVINPVIFMNKAETKVYIYGGMHIDYTTFISHYLYSYDIAARRWNAPTHVQDGPQLVFNGWALNADVSNVLLIGGSFGRTGSHQSAWAWDLTVDPPTFQKLDTQLPYRCESPMVGIDGRGTAWIFSGSVYETAASSDPLAYNHGVLMLSPPASDRTASAYLLNIVIAIATLAIIGSIVGFLFWKNKVSFRRNYEVIPG